MRWILKNYKCGIDHQFPQIVAILSGSLVGVSYGLLTGWTSPAIPEILADNSTDISFEEASYFTVIPPIAMALTAPFCSRFVDVVGRKMGVLLVAVPYLMAWILIAMFNNLWMYYLSRVMSGIGDALFFSTSPIYIGEIAEPRVRGIWGNVVALSTYIGIFLINVIGAYSNIFVTALICGSFPILHILLFCFMPESPYFLLMKDREEEALEALKMLRGRCDVDRELDKIKADVKRQIAERGTLKDLFTISSNRRALVMCLGIRIIQQFSGISAFEAHTQFLFQEAGGSVSHKSGAIIFSGVLVISVSISSYFIERFGRRPLMMFSCFGCGLTLTVETVYFVLKQFTDIDLSSWGWVPLYGMLMYIVICSTGLGILPSLILGEIFSASIKGTATAFMNVSLAAFLILVPKLFHYFTYNFGIYLPFCFFTAWCFIGFAFSYFFVLETKGKTLEEIQQDLKFNRLK